MSSETLQNVPESDVDQVVADFMSEGAEVSKTQNADGSWNVVATFPD